MHILDAIDAPILVHEPTTDGALGAILHANTAAIELSGWTLDQLQDFTLSGLVRAAEPDDFALIDSSADHTLRTASGEPVAVRVQTRPTEWQDRPAEITTLTDLSSRQRIQRALREERALMAGMLDAIPTGVVVTDRHGNVRASSRHLRQLLGLGDGPLPQAFRNISTLSEAVLGPDGAPLPADERVFNRLQRQHQPVIDQHATLRAVDGTTFDVLMNTAAMRGPLGDFSGVVVAAHRLAEVTRLQAMERDLIGLFNAVPDLMFVMRPDGTILDANTTAERAFSEHELKGAPFQLLVPPGDRARAQALLARLQPSAEPQRVRLSMELSAEGTVPVELHLTPGTWKGQPSGIAIARDIREQVARERALENSELELREIFDALPDLVAIIDPDFRIVRANRAMAEATGFSSGDELHSTHCYSIMHATGTPPPNCPHAALLKMGEAQSATLFEPKLEADLLVTTSPLHDSDGKVRGSVHVARDITALRAAKQHATQLGLALDQTSAEVYIHSLDDFRFIYANHGARDNLGYSNEELLGMTPLDVLLHLQPEQFHELLAPLHSGEDVHATAVHRRKDGTEYPVDAKIQPIRYLGRPAALVVIFDTTAHQQAETRLQTLVHDKDLLLREVNHRVKNNLAAILSLLHMQQQRLDPSTASALQPLEDRIQALTTLHQVLSNHAWHPLPIGTLVREVVTPAMQGAHFDLEVRNDCLVNPERAQYLALVLNELATNSRKHAAIPDLQVKILLDQTPTQLILTWRDNGPGYPTDVLAAPHRTGQLGLSLLQGLVRHSLDGQVTLSNDNGALTIIELAQPR